MLAKGPGQGAAGFAMANACRELLERVAAQMRGPDDLVQWSTQARSRCQAHVVALHELRIAVALGWPGHDASHASAIDAGHRYPLEDGRKVSLLQLAVVFGSVDLAAVLGSMAEFQVCEVDLVKVLGSAT